MKVWDQSDHVKETLTYAVLDDQSTDVFITDALKSKLNLKGAEVNLQRVLRFSPLRKNQHFKIPIRSGMLERLIHEPLAREIGQPLLTLSSLNKIDFFNIFFYK